MHEYDTGQDQFPKQPQITGIPSTSKEMTPSQMQVEITFLLDSVRDLKKQVSDLKYKFSRHLHSGNTVVVPLEIQTSRCFNPIRVE